MNLEIEELIKRLEDVEDRILSDAIIVQTIYESLVSLEKIYGNDKDSVFVSAMKKYMDFHKVKNYEELSKKILYKETKIKFGKAGWSGGQIYIWKNNILAEFLNHSGKVDKSRLIEIRNYFAKSSYEGLEKFMKKESNKEQSLQYLSEYLSYLEKEEKFLKQNFNEIKKDRRYVWSLHKLFIHEIQHGVFNEHLNNFKGTIHWLPLNEAISFGMQKFSHLYEDDGVIDEIKIIDEIKEMYRFIPPRLNAYKDNYDLLKPFMLIISGLIISDIIQRKQGNYSGKELLNKVYSAENIEEVITIVDKCIENLTFQTIRELLKNTVMKTAIHQLTKCKEKICENLKARIKNLEDTKIVLQKTNWAQYSERQLEGYLRKFIVDKNSNLVENIDKYVNTLGLLKIMGETRLVGEYKEKYLSELKGILDIIADHVNDWTKEAYTIEDDVVDGMLGLLEAEEEDIKKVILSLK